MQRVEKEKNFVGRLRPELKTAPVRADPDLFCGMKIGEGMPLSIFFSMSSKICVS